MGPSTGQTPPIISAEKNKYSMISSSISGLGNAVTRLKDLRSQIAGEDSDPTPANREYSSLSDTLDSVPIDVDELTGQIHNVIEQIQKLLF